MKNGLSGRLIKLNPIIALGQMVLVQVAMGSCPHTPYILELLQTTDTAARPPGYNGGDEKGSVYYK